MTRDTLITSVVTIERGRERGRQTARQDLLAVEEPLEIRLGETSVSVTMRTPGHDFDLALGFLFTEGIVDDPGQVVSIRHAETPGSQRQAGNTVVVEVVPGLEMDSERLRRNFYSTSSCGICGKASLAAIEIAPRRLLRTPSPIFRADLIHSLPEVLRESQAIFERTGGLHAAALFSQNGELLGLREDVGRHNAMDKLIGFGLGGDSVALDRSVVLISSRAGFEIVQKAVMAGIPVLAAVGAPSSLAVEASRRFGITLLGFVREGRFNIYSGAERIQV
jgi:FdhD protein